MRCIHILLFLLRNLPAFPVPNIFSFCSMSPVSYPQYHRLFHYTMAPSIPRLCIAQGGVSRHGFAKQTPLAVLLYHKKKITATCNRAAVILWRRRRDSNSRTPLRVTRFPIVRARPATRLLRVNLNIQFAPFLQTPEHYTISKAKNQVIFSIIPIFFSQRLKQ